MSLSTVLAVGFLTVLFVGLSLGGIVAQAERQARKNNPRLIIEEGYRSRKNKA